MILAFRSCLQEIKYVSPPDKQVYLPDQFIRLNDVQIYLDQMYFWSAVHPATFPLSRSESHQINQRSIHLSILDIFIMQPNCPSDRLKIFQSERESVFLDSPVDLNLESLRGSKKRENIKWFISVLLQY